MISEYEYKTPTQMFYNSTLCWMFIDISASSLKQQSADRYEEYTLSCLLIYQSLFFAVKQYN